MNIIIILLAWVIAYIILDRDTAPVAVDLTRLVGITCAVLITVFMSYALINVAVTPGMTKRLCISVRKVFAQLMLSRKRTSSATRRPSASVPETSTTKDEILKNLDRNSSR